MQGQNPVAALHHCRAGRNHYLRLFWGQVLPKGHRISTLVWIKAETAIWFSVFSGFLSAVSSWRVTSWRQLLLSWDLHMPPELRLRPEKEMAFSWLERTKPSSVTLGRRADYRQVFLFVHVTPNLSHGDKWNAKASPLRWHPLHSLCRAWVFSLKEERLGTVLPQAGSCEQLKQGCRDEGLSVWNKHSGMRPGKMIKGDAS